MVSLIANTLELHFFPLHGSNIYICCLTGLVTAITSIALLQIETRHGVNDEAPQISGKTLNVKMKLAGTDIIGGLLVSHVPNIPGTPLMSRFHQT